MGLSTFSVRLCSAQAVLLLALTGFVAGCAELDRLTKPGVEGLLLAPDFTSAALTDGGLGAARVGASLKGDAVDPEVLETLLTTAIRSKRPDVPLGARGRYQVTARVIADDVSKRGDDIEGTIYRWAKRRVKVNYAVVDGATQRQVWGGVIETENETLVTYEKEKKKKSSERIVDEIIQAITETEPYPYPDPPFFSDVVKQNFEGFALNLPYQSG